MERIWILLLAAAALVGAAVLAAVVIGVIVLLNRSRSPDDGRPHGRDSKSDR
jgi:hypothetical protein